MNTKINIKESQNFIDLTSEITDIEDYIKSYIKVAEINLYGLDSTYGALDFLFNNSFEFVSILILLSLLEKEISSRNNLLIRP